ncbi:hypothetical protein Hanom_Chr01g00030951 [Helianthus anomalus]
MGIFGVCYETHLKNKHFFFLADCRGLVHLFCCGCLQMWSANCRRFTSNKQTTP